MSEPTPRDAAIRMQGLNKVFEHRRVQGFRQIEAVDPGRRFTVNGRGSEHDGLPVSYMPVHFGGRFSANALGPSMKSALSFNAVRAGYSVVMACSRDGSSNPR